MIVSRVIAGHEFSSPPAEFSAYRRAHAWQLASRGATSATWTLSSGDDFFEILQPLGPGLRDFAARIRDAIHVLAVVEGRSPMRAHEKGDQVSMRGNLTRRGTRLLLNQPSGFRVLVGTPS